MKRILAVAVMLLFMGILPAEDTMQFTDWSAPVSLGPTVNSGYNDRDPTISKSGLSLYFGSDRPDPNAQGGFDIYVSQRDSLEDPWEAPVNLGTTINGPYHEDDTAFSPDGHWLVFTSDRPHGCGGMDLWISHRQNKRDDFGWETPTNLGCVVNSGNGENGPFLIEDQMTGQLLLYFASDRVLGGTWFDIYVSSLSEETGTFGPPKPVVELNSEKREFQPCLRKDVLEIFFVRGQPGFGIDLWVATRETTLDPWSTPVNLTLLNSTAYEYHPTLSWDGTTLIFASQRLGTFDLFMSTRTKLNPQK
ncbi:MAG: hypothetical protein LAP85_10490 [Acidobacteriia bacterium]|nr:hypothetical protein [Terriglobia bacterium]